MPNRAAPSQCRRMVANHTDDEVIAYLCDPNRRVDDRGEPSQFLNDIHDDLHTYGRLTDMQRRGAEAWLRRSNRNINRQPDVEDEAAEADAAEGEYDFDEE